MVTLVILNASGKPRIEMAGVSTAHHPYSFHEEFYLEEARQWIPLAVTVTRNVYFIRKNVVIFRSTKQVEMEFQPGDSS